MSMSNSLLFLKYCERVFVISRLLCVVTDIARHVLAGRLCSRKASTQPSGDDCICRTEGLEWVTAAGQATVAVCGRLHRNHFRRSSEPAQSLLSLADLAQCVTHRCLYPAAEQMGVCCSSCIHQLAVSVLQSWFCQLASVVPARLIIQIALLYRCFQPDVTLSSASCASSPPSSQTLHAWYERLM